MNVREKYRMRGVSLYGIRNKNELRVIRLMPEVLDECPDYVPDSLEIEDIYALTLNLLPPRYTQRHTIVLREPVKEEEIKEKIRQAVDKVRANPPCA